MVFPAFGQGQGAWGPRSCQPTVLYVKPCTWGRGGILSFLPCNRCTLLACWWAVGSSGPCPALPRVYLGLFGALPGDQRGLMGTRLLWGWFRPDLQPGI